MVPPIASDARVVVVLSAGGPAAWMFHLGVLDALEEVGFDPRRAHFVGTSAGAAVAASYKAGATTAEIRLALQAPPSDADRKQMANTLREARVGLAGRLKPLAPHLARQVLPGGRGLAMALAGVLPSGLFPSDSLGRLPALAELDRWPEGLWIPAVDAVTGDVRVFGRDILSASVGDAVAASSAVPAMFQPKDVDGSLYIDGAVSSSTHAGLAAEVRADLAIISTVQTRPGVRPVRMGARRRLRDELAILEARGISTLVVEPESDIRAETVAEQARVRVESALTDLRWSSKEMI